MRFRQRDVAVPEEAGSLWLGRLDDEAPDAGPDASIPPPRSGDSYVTVDERVEGVIGVVAAHWPTVDSSGLSFESDIAAFWFDQADLQATVDGFRQAADQLVRPLRIGDTFWVRGRIQSLDQWEALRDITKEARAMVKVAVAVVAVGGVDEGTYLADPAVVEELDREERASDRTDEASPSGSATARPVI